MTLKEIAPGRQAKVPRTRRTVLAATAGLMVLPAWAGSAKIGDDINADYTLTVNYGLQVRAKSPDAALINGPLNAQGVPTTANMDDGDRNFKKGSLTSNRLSALGELDIKRGDYGFFTRVTGFFDDVYRHSNDNDSPFTVNKDGANNEFTPEARKQMGARARFLDAYAYANFNLGEQQRLSLRLGNQVVQWGEGLFFPNIAGAQSPADGTKVSLPGIEVKDILLPVRQLAAQWKLNPTLTLLGYYQFQYKATELTPPGSFMSYTDVLGPGAQFIIAAPGFNIPIGPDIKPGNHGQWGLGARARIGQDTEGGLYYLRYHDKTPSVVTNYDFSSGVPIPTSYNTKYLDDIKLTGASIATRLGDASVAGEISYKQDVPVLVDSVAGPVSTRANATQAQANFLYIASPNALVKGNTTFVGELAYLHVDNVRPADVFGISTNSLTNTANASALQLSVTPSYPNVFPSWDLDVPINYAQVLSGRPAVAGAFGGLVGKGDKRLSIGANFKYLGNLEVDFSYAAFLGGADVVNRPLADRDYFAVNVKYSF
jgi:hypothetical protein